MPNVSVAPLLALMCRWLKLIFMNCFQTLAVPSESNPGCEADSLGIMVSALYSNNTACIWNLEFPMIQKKVQIITRNKSCEDTHVPSRERTLTLVTLDINSNSPSSRQEAEMSILMKPCAILPLPSDADYHFLPKSKQMTKRFAWEPVRSRFHESRSAPPRYGFS